MHLVGIKGTTWWLFLEVNGGCWWRTVVVLLDGFRWRMVARLRGSVYMMGLVGDD